MNVRLPSGVMATPFVWAGTGKEKATCSGGGAGPVVWAFRVALAASAARTRAKQQFMRNSDAAFTRQVSASVVLQGMFWRSNI